MRASEFIPEDDITGGQFQPVGTHQPWGDFKKQGTIALWDKRWQTLTTRTQRIYAKLKQSLNSEQRQRIGNIPVEVDDTWASGQYRWKENRVIIDLTTFWDLSDHAIAYTVAHELGHVYYGDRGSYSDRTQRQNYDQELAADVFGARLAYQAGYDPNYCFQDFSTIDKKQPGDETHPGYKDRVKNIRTKTGIQAVTYQDKPIDPHIKMNISHVIRGIQSMNGQEWNRIPGMPAGGVQT